MYRLILPRLCLTLCKHGMELAQAYLMHKRCMKGLLLHSAGTQPVTLTSRQRAHHTARRENMDKPRLDLTQHANEALYAFIGRVSLLLVEHNVDAITATMFLREIVEAGGSTLSLEQARNIAHSYVDMVPINT